ncbi:MAG: CBS domain-containing protein [Pirellulales bacterium]
MDRRVVCPYCDFTNIPGEDLCDRCGQSLSDSHLKDPRTAVERGLLSDRVAQLRPKPPITVAPTTPVGDVLRLMAERRIGCVFVVDAGRTVGVFTEKDAVERLGANYAQLRERAVGDFMTGQPAGVRGAVRIPYAIRQMDLGGYRHLPTFKDGNQIEGVISVRDILRYLTEKISLTVTG